MDNKNVTDTFVLALSIVGFELFKTLFSIYYNFIAYATGVDPNQPAHLACAFLSGFALLILGQK